MRRDRPKSLLEATRAAKFASLNAQESEKALEELPRFFAGRRSRPGQLSHSERLLLFRMGFSFKYRKPGHIAADCPSSVSSSSEAPNRSHQLFKGHCHWWKPKCSTNSDLRNSLLVVHVTMVESDIGARALIDSGATHNFVSMDRAC